MRRYSPARDIVKGWQNQFGLSANHYDLDNNIQVKAAVPPSMPPQYDSAGDRLSDWSGYHWLGRRGGTSTWVRGTAAFPANIRGSGSMMLRDQFSIVAGNPRRWYRRRG